MALVPATITVTFISNYSGPHRVCYRIQGSGNPYTCTTSLPATHVICPGGGSPCQYVINIQVDNETCEEVTYEGYVQAACQVEGSTQDRIPFTVTFTPSPSCLRIPITCNNSSVNSITIDSGGFGYSSADIGSSVTISGDGSGATAEISAVSSGQVSAVVITNAGSGYSSATVSFPAPSGGGSAATGSVVLNPCPSFEYESCEGTTIVPSQIQVGETVNLCSQTPTLSVNGGLPSNYSVGSASGTCLCDCSEVELINTSDQNITVYYAVCGSGQQSSINLLPVSTTNIGCIVQGSLQIDWNVDPAEVTVNVIGACNGVTSS